MPTRRELVRIDGLGAAGLTLSSLLRQEARAAAAKSRVKEDPSSRPTSPPLSIRPSASARTRICTTNWAGR